MENFTYVLTMSIRPQKIFLPEMENLKFFYTTSLRRTTSCHLSSVYCCTHSSVAELSANVAGKAVVPLVLGALRESKVRDNVLEVNVK